MSPTPDAAENVEEEIAVEEKAGNPMMMIVIGVAAIVVVVVIIVIIICACGSKKPEPWVPAKCSTDCVDHAAKLSTALAAVIADEDVKTAMKALIEKGEYTVPDVVVKEDAKKAALATGLTNFFKALDKTGAKEVKEAELVDKYVIKWGSEFVNYFKRYFGAKSACCVKCQNESAEADAYHETADKVKAIVSTYKDDLGLELGCPAPTPKKA